MFFSGPLTGGLTGVRRFFRASLSSLLLALGAHQLPKLRVNVHQLFGFDDDSQVERLQSAA